MPRPVLLCQLEDNIPPPASASARCRPDYQLDASSSNFWNTFCTRSAFRMSFTMNQKLCPKIENGCPREIIDVDIPGAVKACTDHQTRVVIEQHLPRVVERADVHNCLASKSDGFPRQIRKHRSDLFLMTWLHFQENAQFVSYAVHRTFPRGRDGVCPLGLCFHFVRLHFLDS